MGHRSYGRRNDQRAWAKRFTGEGLYTDEHLTEREQAKAASERLLELLKEHHEHGHGELVMR